MSEMMLVFGIIILISPLLLGVWIERRRHLRLSDNEKALMAAIINPAIPSTAVTVNILRYWPRDKIRAFALHLLGDVCQDCERNKKVKKKLPRETVEKLEAFVNAQKDIPPEFAEVLNKNFWDLV